MELRLCRALALVLAFVLLPCAALALDLSRTGSIGVRIHTADGVNIERARVEIYRVGAPITENYNLAFKLTDEFAASGLPIEDVNDQWVANELVKYARKNEIAPLDTQLTDEGGWVRFEDLKTGLYVVAQNGFDALARYTEITPFYVMLPMTQDGEWVFNVKAEPKAAPRPTASPGPSPTPGPGDIPQTGLLLWPVIALAAGGVAMFGLGWGLFFVRKKRDDNA